MRIVNTVVLAVMVGAGMLAMPGTASAATFSVNPTQIFLSGRTTSALLTLRNDSDELLRFQLTAFAWTQSATGEIELTASQDVVFFPALLQLKPGEERKVRVGSSVAAGAAEKTYRIFVEELPPTATSEGAPSVRVLTKMGIPIFIRPVKEAASAALASLGMSEGELHFSLNNTGTVHFVPQEVKVRGMAANGQQLFEQELVSWYILSGGKREFEMPVAAEHCSGTTSLVVEVALGANALKESVQTPGGACRQ